MGKVRVGATVVWWVLFSQCFGADKLQPVALDQFFETAAQHGVHSDEDRSRSRVNGVGGVDLIRSEASAGCFEVSSESRTLLQGDLARISLNTDIQACRSSGESFVTASGTSKLTLSVERTARRVVSLSKSSTEPLTGSVTLSRVGMERPLWHVELEEDAKQMSSAFAIDLSVGEYVLELTSEQQTSRSGTSDIRVSIVNRGDINGNEEFDNADLEVLNAILRQPTFVVTADLDDDGDNDSADRRLWVDGLRPEINQTSRNLDIVPVTDVLPEGPAELFPVDDSPDEPDAIVTEVPSVDEVIEPEVPLVAEEVVEVSPIGDINGDGTVGFGDFLSFSRSFGLAAESNELADFDEDGFIGFPDFLVFSRSYNRRNEVVTTVRTPEPDAFGLLMVAFVGLAFSQRERAKAEVGRNLVTDAFR